MNLDHSFLVTKSPSGLTFDLQAGEGIGITDCWIVNISHAGFRMKASTAWSFFKWTFGLPRDMVARVNFVMRVLHRFGLHYWKWDNAIIVGLGDGPVTHYYRCRLCPEKKQTVNKSLLN